MHTAHDFSVGFDPLTGVFENGPPQATAPIHKPRKPCIHLGSRRRCCDNLYICHVHGDCSLTETPVDGLRACSSCSDHVPSVQSETQELTVIISCHNYGDYLEEALESIANSSMVPHKVIVVDDSSDPPVNIANVCMFGLNVAFYRVEFKSQAQTNLYGFEAVHSKYVMFLDADDKLHEHFIANALLQFEDDTNIAFVYPTLEAFGLHTGPMHQTAEAPSVVSGTDLERRNWCPASTIFRTTVLRQSLAVKGPRVIGCACSDWITARTVLRSGPWKGVQAKYPLFYRQHNRDQMHKRPAAYRYDLQANMENETVTVIIAFSGRWQQWKRLRAWLESQTWPRHQTRLLILNSSHADVSIADLDLEDFTCQAIQLERINAGSPALADKERRNVEGIGALVDAAVAGLYNRALQMVFGEWVLFLEDDVIPHNADAIARLLAYIEPDVACVSGAYKHRYQEALVAFVEIPKLAPVAGPDVCKVAGSGFGCLMARKSVLSKIGLAGDILDHTFFDVSVGPIVDAMGYRWLLARTVVCDHLTQQGS